MIVCICNCIRETEIRAQSTTGTQTATDVFRSFGCEPNCATCIPDIEQILDRSYASASGSATAN